MLPERIVLMYSYFDLSGHVSAQDRVLEIRCGNLVDQDDVSEAHIVFAQVYTNIECEFEY
jgi:hypothetical protein